MPTKDLTQIFDLIKGQDVFVFGCDKQISELFLDPYEIHTCNTCNTPIYKPPIKRQMDIDNYQTGLCSSCGYATTFNSRVLNVIEDTYIREKTPPSWYFDDLRINLGTLKRKWINDIFLKEFGFKDKVTIGVNLFSAFYKTNIALWADKTEYYTREILLHSEADIKLTIKERIDCVPNITDEMRAKITHCFNWQGERDKDFKAGNFDLEYNGYLWWSRTITEGAIHLCALAGAKSCVVSGAAWNPITAGYFYENINNQQKKHHRWVDPESIPICKTFIAKFPNTKFYKTNPNSFIPFEYKDLKEFL